MECTIPGHIQGALSMRSDSPEVLLAATATGRYLAECPIWQEMGLLSPNKGIPNQWPMYQ